MTTTNLLADSDVRFAYQFVEALHDGHRDKAGFPYIGHLSRVAMRVMGQGKTTVIAALLHDVIEDTALTTLGITSTFGMAVGQTVRVLTHVKGQSYAAYMEQVMAGPYAAWEVKAADLADNTDPKRIEAARGYSLLTGEGVEEFDKAQARRDAKYRLAVTDLLDHARKNGVRLAAEGELRERFGLNR